MAADIFLEFEGLEGECQVKGFEKQIDVDSFSWGASNACSIVRGGGGGVAKGDSHDLTVTGMIDKASPELWLKCMCGQHFPKATLTARKASGEAASALEYLKLTMEKVYISSWNISGSASTGFQSVSLCFEKVTIKYTSQSETGGEADVCEITRNIMTME